MSIDITLSTFVGSQTSADALVENEVFSVEQLIVMFWAKGCNFGSWLKSTVGLDCGAAAAVDSAVLTWCEDNKEACYGFASAVFLALIKDETEDLGKCVANTPTVATTTDATFNAFVISNLTSMSTMLDIPKIKGFNVNKLKAQGMAEVKQTPDLLRDEQQKRPLLSSHSTSCAPTSAKVRLNSASS